MMDSIQDITGECQSLGLSVFSILWEACEVAGTFPPQVSDAQAPLIPKKKGGYRDLCLLPSFQRVGFKARRPYADSWERDHDAPYFTVGKAKAAPDSVWKAALLAEAGA